MYVNCEVCHGTRYNAETLEIHYRGKNIADVLNMTVEEALGFFENFPHIHQMLKALNDVGLSYVKLGQPSTQLSGGEAQRVKLATELGKNPTGHTLYVLDEPTTGLHFADIHNLLNVLNRLADMGNTILVIEHNLDVIKCADWLIDMGPEGGDGGRDHRGDVQPDHHRRHHQGRGLDERIGQLIDKGLDDSAIAWELDDELVKGAQAEFLPVWEQTRETTATSASSSIRCSKIPGKHAARGARKPLHRAGQEMVGRPSKNRMIKVPATPAGLARWKSSPAHGVTLNVTLFFSERQYKISRDAIWRGASAARVVSSCSRASTASSCRASTCTPRRTCRTCRPPPRGWSASSTPSKCGE